MFTNPDAAYPGIRLLALILAMGIAGCSSAPFISQQGPVGTVIRSQGVPGLTRQGGSYMLDNYSQLFTGDIVRTDNTSLIEVELASGTRMTLSPGSDLRIDDIETNSTMWRSRYNLSSGALEIKSGGSADCIVITTNIARVVSISADLWIGYSAGYERLHVVLINDAEVIVRNTNGETRLVSSMEATTVIPGGAPLAMSHWSAAKLNATRAVYNQLHQSE